MQRVRSASAAGVAGLALVLVSACGGHGVSDTSAASTPSPAASVPVVTPSPVASPTATGKATEYATNTPRSAEQFAKLFTSRLDIAYKTDNPEVLRGLMLPSCRVCNRYLQSIANAKRSHIHYYGVGYVRAKALGVGTAAERYVRVYGRDLGEGLVSPDGKVRRTRAAQTGHLTYLFAVKNGEWKVEAQTGQWVPE
jgi:hypothetical protein